MKAVIHLKIILLCVILSFSVVAQDAEKYLLQLKSGSFVPERNVSKNKIKDLNRRLVPFNKKSFVIIQFEKNPSESERQVLKKDGIELLDYVPNNAYTATLTGVFNEVLLQKSGVRAVVFPVAEQKLQTSLANGTIPVHAKKVAGFVDVWVNFPRSFTAADVLAALKNDHYEVLSDIYKDYQVLEIRVEESKLNDLAQLPFIQYIQAIPKEDRPVNDHSTVNGRANVLNAAFNMGRNLRGEGVVVGVGDESNPLQHIDFSSRVINRAAIDFGAHGVHVIGTLAGAGIVSEKYTGYAPKAKIVSQLYSNILAYAPIYVQDFGMVITNNSYGNNITDCATFGEYDLNSYILDQQAFQMPYLQHVFASGNSGGMNCAPFTGGFGSVVGGYQAAKNVITVGNTTMEGDVWTTSSRGPVADGRIKPEISAQGRLVMSTYAVDNSYINSTGTSMASPAVSGGLALLYQQYRKLNNQNNPKNGLMKAILCNGTTDLGHEGPDYQYGFGWLNLLRSVKMIENNSYLTGSATHGSSNLHEIQVPPGTAKLKVMLYWNDPAASVFASRTLVNDLDLEVKNPSNITTLPKLLDPTPANVGNAASTGPDHINNMEQVIINDPGAGTYKINIKGTEILQNPQQEYFLVYDAIPVATELTYPVGNEHFKPGDDINISWESYGNTSSNFTVQYSTNDGATWTNVLGNPVTSKHLLRWVVPDVVTDKAKVKITQSGTGIEVISKAFTILPPPVFKISDIQCEGYIAVDWQPVTGATDYEVMLLHGDEMVSAGTTTSNSFVMAGMSRDSLYWFSVRARLNQNPGPRATALSRKPDSGTCAGSISDNDLKLEAIVSPVSSGRQFTPTALSDHTPVTIRVRNLDDQATAGNVAVSYSVNGSLKKSLSVPLSIAANSFTDYIFPDDQDLSALGSYVVSATINKVGDIVIKNNTLSKIFKQLPNNPVALPFIDNLESASEQSVLVGQVGLEHADRYDFTNSSTAGRLRTFVNTGMAYSGNRALTLDTDRYFPSENTNFLYGTFNFSNYSLADDIRLVFRYKNHGQTNHADNKVWIRGSYADNWILVYDLFANQNSVNQSYKLSTSIELANILADHGQPLSKSAQIRWGQHGKRITASPSDGSGYSFDDIQLRIEMDDIQMLSLNSITAASCGLGSLHPVTVTIRNSSDRTINNVPVRYKLGTNNEVTEMIPVINGRQTIQYTFNTKLNLSAFGEYYIKVWSALNTDTYADNNMVDLIFYNNALVTTFPHLENFENSNGGWHSGGTSKSWSYGTPASTKINGAASGTKAWKTNLNGNYNNQENSYLYSPCYNISGMANPTLSFSLALDIEFCANEDCDLAYLEYSIDGNVWTQLGAKGQGTNWYNKTTTDKQAWSIQDYTRWHVGTIPLPVTNGNIRLRFVMIGDPGTTREGIAIDDIHIYNNNSGIYDESTTLSPVLQQPPSPSGWIDFKQNGKLVVSINPNGQTIGATNVQAYINGGAIRDDGKQYYLDRNVTIKPAHAALGSNATVRIYFLDTEAEKLINAATCVACPKVKTAFELGVFKYTDADKSKEDGSLTNNQAGVWKYINSASTLKVPFDKGYYAEIGVKDFSEFWFSNGDNSNPLPVDLISFNVNKKTDTENPDQVIAQWVTTSEINADRFEVERADGLEALKLKRFAKIGEVSAAGDSRIKNEYFFTDNESPKSGDYYYRLKMLDRDESFKYSSIRAVSFDLNADWKTYPNPSNGSFEIQYQAGAGMPMRIKAFDLTGNLVYDKSLTANGKRQQHQMDLSGSGFSAGLYVVEVTSNDQKKVFRIVKL
ncbi:S8 family serine peptidase [Dyadobacter sp. LHD-138]|uniref:S8 family serine peptidase n=1 Tax=Dyadobacter sp. LHD-138 TaxID=3071413 RepID=UPI0027E1056F|nr:S8 family serine peptidase [Dyadobacter sp. LHD-138]MDQ6479881.1 S8 family serine peptidase [Dyadobacter sp. LHD-138]